MWVNMHRHQTQSWFTRDALKSGACDPIIHALLVEIAQHRPLTRAEIRLRCITRSTPWRESGISHTTYYRRLSRANAAVSP